MVFLKPIAIIGSKWVFFNTIDIETQEIILTVILFQLQNQVNLPFFSLCFVTTG